jgi:hypothetical protein
MLISLLQDKNINGIENLVVNEKDPFSKYVSNNGKLGEINSGSWYEQAYKTMVKDPDKDFLLPIIFAMDKTTISSTARMSVYAVMFTTTLFDYKTRNKAQAWRPLGYIPIEKNFHSSAQWTRMDKKLKSKCENLFFETVLHSFREAQQDGALDGVPLTLGNKTKAVNLKVPLAFIIGDIQGGDGICGRSAYYRADAKRICRMCDATPAAYISTDMDCCNMLVMEDIRQLCLNKDEDKLESMLQSVNYQAFYDIDYGGSPGGVFTAACPPEALHSLENGLVLHCLKQLFEEILGQPARANLDDIVQQWLNHPKQCHMKSYMAAFPRLLFKDGLTTITDISAGTKIGILFAFVLAAQTNDGRNLLMKHDKTATLYGDMIQVFEMLLCYWAWLKKEEYWHHNDSAAFETAKNAIWVLVNRLKTLFPRKLLWNIPKLHEQLHIAMYILLFGAHRNMHTGSAEHNHIENTKKPSERTQKRKAVFDLQIANRLVDKYVIDHTHTKILKQQSIINMYEEKEGPAVPDESTHYAAKFIVNMKHNPVTKKTDLTYDWITPAMVGKLIDKKLLKTIRNLTFKTLPLEQQLQGIKVQGLTEYTRQQITFRCHPNYRNEGPWYDYAMFAWEQPLNQNITMLGNKGQPDWNKEVLHQPVATENSLLTSDVMLIPAKIHCLIEDHNGKMFALIHSCLDNSRKMSVLTYRWQLEFLKDKPVSASYKPHDCGIDASTLTPVYRLVSVDTLQKHCLMIPYDTNKKSRFLMQVVDQDKWWESFTTV